MKQDRHYHQADNHTHETCCHWEGCANTGSYPAPKSPDQLHEKYNFCLEHIRLYNKTWNYFNGMNSQDIERFQRETLVGHRPTFKAGVPHKQQWDEEKIRKALHSMFQDTHHHTHSTAENIPQNEKDALDTLELTPPVNWTKIRKKYKLLVKVHHPDINNGEGEERLKCINQAYSYLKTIYSGA